MLLPPPIPSRKRQIEQLELPPAAEALRAACLESLATFGESFFPGWQAQGFHEYLASRLEDCLRRKVKRLCLSVPPQHGKSRLSSVLFPAWALTKDPTLRIVQVGYSSDLSEGFTRDARSLVRSERYREIFPQVASPELDRAGEWKTMLGGSYFATSITGAGTGRPADILIVDDPFKNAEDAANERIRNQVWDLFTTTFLTRLADDGIVIIIQTRWHPDDLIGRATNKDKVAKLKELGLAEYEFEVINLEAICEDPQRDPLGRAEGDALCPELKSLKFLKYQKESLSPADWAAIYQGRPQPKGGRLVDGAKLKYIDAADLPAGLKPMRAWDLSVGATQASDYSAGVLGAVKTEYIKCSDGVTRPFETLYIMDIDRARRYWPKQKERIVSCADSEAVGGFIGLETIGAWEVAKAELEMFFQGRTQVRGYKPAKDKATRAQAWFNLIEAGRCFVVRGPWNAEFRSELEAFPNGAHDDQIDGVSTLYYTFQKGCDLVMA